MNIDHLIDRRVAQLREKHGRGCVLHLTLSEMREILRGIAELRDADWTVTALCLPDACRLTPEEAAVWLENERKLKPWGA